MGPISMCRSGIVAHYINEYSGARAILTEFGENELIGQLRERPIRHYEEVIRAMGAEVDLSSPIIPILNQCADYINNRALTGNLEGWRFTEIRRTIEELITGEPAN